MKKSMVFLILSVVLLSISTATAADQWPTWRGPDMSGVCPDDAKPPVSWSESENIKWKVKLTGDGSDSSPIIWDDMIIFQSAVQTDKKAEGQEEPAAEENTGGRRRRGRKPTNIYNFNVVCLDRNNGQTIWEKTVTEALPHEGHHGDHGFASFSPITDGKLIWACFGSRGLYCLDMKGNLKWQKELPQMQIRAGFGEGNSPALAGDNLIVLIDHEGASFIAAYNKKTGDQVWKKDRDERTSWTTPRVFEHDGQMQILVTGSNRSRCYDAKNGDVLWECGGQTDNVIPTPLIGFGMAFCTSGFRGAMLQAIKLGQSGDLTDSDAIVWKVTEATPYVPSGILAGGKVYVCSGNNGEVSCYDAKTGKPHYVKQKMEEMKNIYASPVAANGKVYFVGRNGVTYVLDGGESFNVVSVNKLDDGIDSSPAVIGNEMYLKGKQYLYCIAESK